MSGLSGVTAHDERAFPVDLDRKYEPGTNATVERVCKQFAPIYRQRRVKEIDPLLDAIVLDIADSIGDVDVPR